MILSPGRRCELIKYFKKGLNKEKKKLITVDINKYAPALYVADKFYVIKKDFNDLKSYIDKVIEICKIEKITFLLTLIDPELRLLSRYRNDFAKNNIRLVLSSDDAINCTSNKYLFYSRYKEDLKLIRTYRDRQEVIREINKEVLKYPIIAKPIMGSSSIGIHKINSAKELETCKFEKKYIYQEYISGREIGVDLYFDLISGKLVSVFMKEKIAMRAGETDKSISIFQKDILTEIQKLEKCGNYRGPIDVDMFISEDGEGYINEINPRFGGGYPHAHYCGVDFIKLIINNMNGIENKVNIGNYKLDVMMMKGNKFIFMDSDKIDEE